MRVPPLLARHESGDVFFYGAGRGAEGESETVRDAKNVSVDGERRFFERNGHHDVGRFAADAGKRFERLAI